MNAEYARIIELIKCEVVPAIGCTEPIAVALCVARAAEILSAEPQAICVQMSPNIYKNAMGVGIPATGMIGLPIAVALGATVGRSEYGLEVLRDVTPAAVERAKEYMHSVDIGLDIDKQTSQKLYIRVEVRHAADSAVAIIAGGHTNFVYLSHNGEVLLDNMAQLHSDCAEKEGVQLTMRRVYDFAINVPIDDVRFILRAKEMNMAAAEASFDGDYGHGLGRLLQLPHERAVIGDTVFAKMLSYTCGACDARMSGAKIEVMSNSGSGNQGIASTVPVVVYGQHAGASEEQMIRALTLSSLMVIYIKQSLGRLSALCGCVVAATGSSCGITYLMGGGYEELSYAVKNMVANITGMICDGAKPSCALKVTSGVSVAVLSAMLAMEHRHTTSVEGIIDDDVDKCIRNMTAIGRDGMIETDKLILDIMTHKNC